MHNLNNCSWQAFELDKIFDIKATQSSIDKKNLVQGYGNTPYVTRSDKENGIDAFVPDQPQYRIDEGNVITIGLDTQTVFYQEHQFYTGQNIQVLRQPNLNKYVAVFLIIPIKKLMLKFNWGGNGATLTRLKRSKIYLPATALGEPDWHFMESYMRQKEQSLLKPIVKRLCKRLIYNEIQGGVIYLPILGNHSNSMKSSLLSKGARDLKRPTMSMVRHHMFRPRRLTMGLMGLSATKTV